MKRPAMEMLTRSRKEMALMANIQKMRSQRMGIGTYNDTRRRPRNLDSCAKNLLTGAAVDATFEAGCCFCSIGYPEKTLSRRERQMMDILYRRGRATASEIHAEFPDRPSYSAVRAKLRVLEEKGHVRHEEQALRYVYLPTVPRDRARQSALRHLLATFSTIPASRPSPPF